MFNWLNRKVLHQWASALAVVVLVLSALPVSAAQAQAQSSTPAPAPMVVALNKGWTKFSWVPRIRGTLAFAALFISPDNSANLTLPSLLTFTASAQVNCPRAGGDAVVNVKVYDFNQLILALPYTVTCARRAQPLNPIALRTADDYFNDPHYLHVTVPVATGGAHNLVVTTDLATQDSLFWGYVRADTAVGVAPASTSRGAIAVTAVNPPATAWAGVQWKDADGVQWHNIDSWFGALNQTDGRMAFWVDASQFGTGPYRWVIYDQDPGQGGKLWGASDPFMFPRTAQDWVWMKATQAVTPVR